MFTGAKINETEGRAVLHTALRNLDGRPVRGRRRRRHARGRRATRQRMAGLRRGAALGRADRRRAGGRFTDVVNIGIGGSDLGPAMAHVALAPYADGPRCHFVSNVDGAHIADVLRGLAPETTLVIVASKTFTTIETMTNAATARDWLAAKVGQRRGRRASLRAVARTSTRPPNGASSPTRVFGFEDWVGGRYSVWGPIGLSLMLAVGPGEFPRLPASAPARWTRISAAAEGAANMPVMLALVGIWHNQICGYATRAVLPYEQRLARLPAYLQQLEMESNGKRVAMDGSDLPVQLRPGGLGRARHQRPARLLPADPSGHPGDPLRIHGRPRRATSRTWPHQHRLLIANCLAQSEALMRGRSLDGGDARSWRRRA